MAVPLVTIILAAGESTRMNSKKPKVLLPVAGLPMIEYALRNAEALSPSKIFVVVGAQSKEVSSYVQKRATTILQKERLGTGHAVQQVLPYLKSFKGNVLILYADDCLTRSKTVLALRQFHLLQNAAATLLTARVDSPFGYGRIIRGSGGEVVKVVEETDASQEEKRINEINAGVYLFKAPVLAQSLKSLKTAKGKKEFYMTEAVPHVIGLGEKVQALMVPDQTEVLGINNRAQLSWAHSILNLRRINEHRQNGVTFLNPKTVEINEGVLIGRDSVIEGNTQILGKTILGEDCRVEAGSVICSSRIGRGVVIRNSRIMDSKLGDACDAGPFAHIRGGSALDKYVHVGTNAELKNAKIASGSKVGHFSYVGDAKLGRDVNVGAGCVFANFDGKNKHECQVGDKAFLGSNSTLVAPVKIGAKAVVAAGAVVTKDVPAGVTVVGVPARPMKRKNNF
ncbi:MAG TPA: bifunctional UDP-N-acetylglucosamine diphosphorylase/glucosamine-1-phosphate N-acetyltransferase GlmU [bacterium]|nr:bifunctional UDP-N-acetylglucosamine diphosphorylase/glucosamine-1-phosphate N-acetyltransferase GlmU [bacterium]